MFRSIVYNRIIRYNRLLATRDKLRFPSVRRRGRATSYFIVHLIQINASRFTNIQQRISSAQNHALATRTSINIETHPPLNFLHFRRVFSRSEHLKYLRNSVASLSTTPNDQTRPIHPFEKSLANRIPGYISNTKRSPCRCIQWRRKLMQRASIAMQKRTFLKGTAH